MNLVLNVSKTVAAEPVQLMRTKPRHLVGCLRPKRAKTLALNISRKEFTEIKINVQIIRFPSKAPDNYPAPSPNPITYFTCKKSNTVTKSSPRVWSDGNWKLVREQKKFQLGYFSLESATKHRII
jgi:hypothetical protein